MRRLGKELGADPTAIYRHFRDKDDVVVGVLDRLIAECVARVDGSAPWRERMTQLAQVSLEVFSAHPAVGALAASQTTGGPGEAAAIEMILQAMAEAGLDQADSVRFYAVLSSYVIAFSSAQSSSRLGSSPGADDPRLDRQVAGLPLHPHPDGGGGTRRAGGAARPRHLRVGRPGHPRRRHRARGRDPGLSPTPTRWCPGACW